MPMVGVVEGSRVPGLPGCWMLVQSDTYEEATTKNATFHSSGPKNQELIKSLGQSYMMHTRYMCLFRYGRGGDVPRRFGRDSFRGT